MANTLYAILMMSGVKQIKLWLTLVFCITMTVVVQHRGPQLSCSSLATDRTLRNTFNHLLDHTVLPLMNFSRTCNRCNRKAFSYSLSNPHFCNSSSELFMLTMVLSMPLNSELRSAIRHTWGLSDDTSVRTLFIVGKSGVASVDQDVLREATLHGDMIIMNMMESYKNLTLKTTAAFHWAETYCQNAKFYLKSDDDCFININKYTNYLRSIALDDAEFIAGNCFTTKPDRSPSSKWFVTSAQYDQLYYPMFCGGPAYVLPAKTARKLLRVSENIRELFLEDVWFTGFCRIAAGINYLQIPGYYSNPDVVEACNIFHKAFTIHRVQPRHMFHFQQMMTAYDSDTNVARSPASLVLVCIILVCLSLVLLPCTTKIVFNNLYHVLKH